MLSAWLISFDSVNVKVLICPVATKKYWTWPLPIALWHLSSLTPEKSMLCSPKILFQKILFEKGLKLALPRSSEVSGERLVAKLFESFLSYLDKNYRTLARMELWFIMSSPNPRRHWLVVEEHWSVSPNIHWLSLLIDDIAVHPRKDKETSTTRKLHVNAS